MWGLNNNKNFYRKYINKLKNENNDIREMKKNILLIHPYFGEGGAEKGIRKLSKFLAKEGYLIYMLFLSIFVHFGQYIAVYFDLF